MTFLSICMPSNRDFARSFSSIETAVAYCHARDAVLILSDNSGDREKQHYWQGRSDRLIWLDSGNAPALLNTRNALRRAETPFLIMMGDDDRILHDPKADSFDLSAVTDDCVGVRPVTEVFTTSGGIERRKDFAIAGATPRERITEYFQSNGGDNSAYYSIFRTEAFRDLFELFYAHHPTKGTYTDWAVMLALLSFGPMPKDSSTIFQYNLDQWSTREKVDRKIVDLFQAVGLPGDSNKHHYLLLVLDTMIFVLRPGTMLSRPQALDAVSLLCGSLFNAYLDQVDAAPENYTETTRHLADLARPEQEAMTRFQIALVMADQILPGLKDRYVAYYAAAQAWPEERQRLGS